uniref:Ig-like domain-containing protein n=1 Tax=Sphaeramia orbicularis TaxID=375764 RepID=A0A673A951_9TELE
LVIEIICRLIDCASQVSKVHQNPPDIYRNQGEKAEITCSHQIDDYFVILWYRQTNNDMKLLGYMSYDSANKETEVTVQISGDARKGETCTLTTEELSLNSSAVYFCAASQHSDVNCCVSVQKPPRPWFFHLSITDHTLHLY